MLNYLVITALGENSSHLVESLSKTIKDCGCNIVESRMIVLGSEFSTILMLSGTWDAIAKMEDMFPKLEKQLRLAITSKRTKPVNSPGNVMPYAIDVVSLDHVGVVHDIADFITSNNIAIQDVYTNSYQAANTGTQMFSLHMTINIPTDISIATLRGDFIDFCDRLNLDAIMEPVK
jgi:glycine cleavage system transcriptional repressor